VPRTLKSTRGRSRLTASKRVSITCTFSLATCRSLLSGTFTKDFAASFTLLSSYYIRKMIAAEFSPQVLALHSSRLYIPSRNTPASTQNAHATACPSLPVQVPSYSIQPNTTIRVDCPTWLQRFHPPPMLSTSNTAVTPPIFSSDYVQCCLGAVLSEAV
jgi:hypothetical protein